MSGAGVEPCDGECDCLSCRIVDLVNGRHPDGLDAAAAEEVLKACACLAGQILGSSGGGVRSAFLGALMAHETDARRRNAEEAVATDADAPERVLH